MNKPSDTPMDAAELEAFESWLRTRLIDTPPSGVERIKLRVQLAAREEALRRSMPLLDARGSTERIKRSVRESLTSSPSRDSARSTRLVWWFGVTAVAAALGFAIVLVPLQSGGPATGSTTLSTTKTADEMDAEGAFELSMGDDLDDAVASLEESLDNLETGLAEGWAATGEDAFDWDDESDEASPQSGGNGDKSGCRRTPGEFLADAVDLKNAIVDGDRNDSVDPPRNIMEKPGPLVPEFALADRDQKTGLTSLLEPSRHA